MRLYKAYLDNDFKVSSCETVEDIETLISKDNNSKFNIDNKAIIEYLELLGYITVYRYDNRKDEFIMYLDIDFQFHKKWDNDTSIYVVNQIKRKNRELIAGLPEPNYIHTNDNGIIGEATIYKDTKTYLYHKFVGGVWNSSEPDIVSIDEDGCIVAKQIGKSKISYIVDTGNGTLHCFKSITVKYFTPKALLN